MKSSNLELLNIGTNNIAWLIADTGEVYGVVNAFNVLDEDGLIYEGANASDLLSQHCDVNQNYDTENNEIEFVAENGESATLVISAESVKLIDNN